MSATFNPSVSFFAHARANTPEASETLTDLIKLIRSPQYKAPAEAIRAITGPDEKEVKKLRAPLKKQLPAVTWSGTFSKRSKEPQHLIEYSHIICHDVDNLSEEQLRELWFEVNNDSWVHAAFLSPSGNGLKILFRTETGAEEHLFAWQAFANMMRDRWGAIVDESTKDICRLCFLSHDPAALLNKDARPMARATMKLWYETKVKAPPSPQADDEQEMEEPEMVSYSGEGDEAGAQPEPSTTPAPQPKPTTKASPERPRLQSIDPLQKCHEIVQRTVSAGQGTHNRYAGQFSQQAARYGIEEGKCLLELATYMPSYDQTELKKTVAHHYKKEGEAGNIGKYLQQALFPTAATSASRPDGSDYDSSIQFWYVVGKVDKATGEIMMNPANGEPLGEYKLSYDDLINFLQTNGFYKYRGENFSYQFINIDNRRKVADIVVERHMKEYVLDYLKSRETMEFKRVREMFRRGAKNYCGTAILEGLDYYNPTLRKDTREAGYIYFQNCFLEITAEGIHQQPYTEQEKFIWAKQLKSHTLTLENGQGCDFARFLMYAITGEKKFYTEYSSEQLTKWDAACTSLGYLLHRYKDPTLTKAIITTDKALRHGTENEGRSGKSLVGKALEYMLICTGIDGRNFSFDKDFAFQKVNIDTQLINFNDIKPKFDFTRLFGMITEEFTFEKKGKDMITIPFDDAPKFYISSNSTLRGEGSSTRARQQIIEFSNYFNEQHTPVQEFGKRFFSGWDAAEWNRFYNFMTHCLHLYLKEGLLDFPLENYAINALYETPGCGEEFVDYMNETVLPQVQHGIRFDSSKLFDTYKAARPEELKWLKKNTFTKWVKKWAEINELKVNAHRPDGRDKSGGTDWMTFTRPGQEVKVSDAAAAPAAEDDWSTPPAPKDESTELPF